MTGTNTKSSRSLFWNHQFLAIIIYLWLISFVLVTADDDLVDDHFEPPSEEDVAVYQACIAEDGFGGQPSDEDTTIQYYQEITYTNGPSFGTDIVRDVDLATVNELLAKSRISCVRPPAVVAEIIEEEEDDLWNRKLQSRPRRAVGISANPENAILQLNCNIPPSSGQQSCVVVDSGFTVFYIGDASANDGFEDNFRADLQEVVDSGRLNLANDQIVTIRLTDPATYRPFRTGGPGVETRGNGDLVPREASSLPIIVGALVGSMLIGASGVAYHRSQRAAQSSEIDNDSGHIVRPSPD